MRWQKTQVRNGVHHFRAQFFTGEVGLVAKLVRNTTHFWTLNVYGDCGALSKQTIYQGIYGGLMLEDDLKRWGVELSGPDADHLQQACRYHSDYTDRLDEHFDAVKKKRSTKMAGHGQMNTAPTQPARKRDHKGRFVKG